MGVVGFYKMQNERSSEEWKRTCIPVVLQRSTADESAELVMRFAQLPICSSPLSTTEY
jgi:hypothetical protein